MVKRGEGRNVSKRWNKIIIIINDKKIYMFSDVMWSLSFFPRCSLSFLFFFLSLFLIKRVK